MISDVESDHNERVGFVHEAVLEDHPGLVRLRCLHERPAGFDRRRPRSFVQAGLPEDRLYYDSFDYAPDGAGADSQRARGSTTHEQQRLAVIGLLLLFAVAPAAHALRCGTRLVSSGDQDFQVRERCGNPYWIEDHYQTVVAGDERIEIAQPTQYSAWFFNFGANRLLVRLLFRDGRLVREETLNRGVDELGAACSPVRLSEGISSGELVAYCGEPTSRRVEPALITRRWRQSVQPDESYRED